jgi:drug/metabolite transporter (DMT)-like permease
MHDDAPLRRQDWLLLAVPGLIWGSSFFFIAEGLEAFEPPLITALRILFGFAALALVPAARRPVPRADLPRVALLGVLWLAFPLTMFSFAEQHVSSSVTGMLNGATPLFVAAVASLIAHRLPPRAQRHGLVVGFAGVVLIALPTLGEGSSSWLGVAMILAALMSYGVALNLAVPLQQRHGAVPVIWRAQVVALVLTAPFGVAAVPGSSFAWGSLLAVVTLGALGTGVAYAVAATLAGRVGSTRASVTTYLIPVVSLALGVALRDETVALLAVAGCAVALLGAYLTNRSRVAVPTPTEPVPTDA